MCSNEHYIATDYTEIQIFTYSLSIDEKIRLKSQRQKLRYNLKSSCSLSSRTLEQAVNLVVKVLFTAVSYALRAKPLWQQKTQILDPPFILAQWCLIKKKQKLNIVSYIITVKKVLTESHYFMCIFKASVHGFLGLFHFQKPFLPWKITFSLFFLVFNDKNQ